MTLAAHWMESAAYAPPLLLAKPTMFVVQRTDGHGLDEQFSQDFYDLHVSNDPNGSRRLLTPGPVPRDYAAPMMITESFNMAAIVSDLALNQDQIAQFEEQGFLCIPRITSPEEVASLREVLARLFTQRAGWGEGAHFDLVSTDETQDSTLRQILNPVNYAPELRDTLYRANAALIARQLLGEKANPLFEHSILKQAERGLPTPWHQDEAYRVSEDFEYEQISIWMPLQDVSEEHGCMQYIPGSHKRGLLSHRRANADSRAHALECEPHQFDARDAVACPLPAGGAVIHSGCTLHYAGANRTPTSRLAYTIAFERLPRPAASRRNFHWNAGWQSADTLRRRAWLKKGGWTIELLRRARYGELYKPDRLAYEIRRLFKRLIG